MPDIIYEKRGHIAYVTINQPRVMNALGPQQHEEMVRVWCDFRDDSEMWVAIITGAGDRAFCAGADLKTYTPLLAERDLYDTRQDANRLGFGGITRGLEIWKPLIAAVNGYALAGGLELALACDIRIASENAQFGCFEIRRGLPNPPDPLIRLIGFGPALHMLLSGDLFDAEEALRFGLVTKVVPASELMPTVESLAQRIAAHQIEVLRATKKAAFTGRDLATEQSEMYTRALTAPLRDSPASREGVTAFAEGRRANYG